MPCIAAALVHLGRSATRRLDEAGPSEDDPQPLDLRLAAEKTQADAPALTVPAITSERTQAPLSRTAAARRAPRPQEREP